MLREKKKIALEIQEEFLKTSRILVTRFLKVSSKASKNFRVALDDRLTKFLKAIYIPLLGCTLTKSFTM